ncbi:hypothetical protein K1S16_28285 [Klebsiella pneumoniae]|uniref:hypothetical protein n=1 Tax=Klebsiella pneumoniae TaxID=573 RepID=UPI001CE14CB9|nr:hypothetical protein [Klebsiella pneumoniae]MCA5536551.1 hypothetical protein [Klebsiella pneumoniae]MEB2425555.1 hypothetical protein [Klebsiella pneumoniae]
MNNDGLTLNQLAERNAALVTEVEKLRAERDQLAAENVGLKAAHPQPFGSEMMKALEAYEWHQEDCPESGMLDAYFILRDSIRLETPATDAFLAGIKADGVTAALESCSDCLDTDCVMDRLDISYEDAEKRTSGAIEFHDAMVNFASQMREGADK